MKQQRWGQRWWGNSKEDISDEDNNEMSTAMTKEEAHEMTFELALTSVTVVQAVEVEQYNIIPSSSLLKEGWVLWGLKHDMTSKPVGAQLD